MKAKCIHPGPWHTSDNPPPQGWPQEGTEYDVECVVFDEQGVWLKLTAWPGDDYFAAARFDIAPAQAADAKEEFPTIIIAVELDLDEIGQIEQLLRESLQ